MSDLWLSIINIPRLSLEYGESWKLQNWASFLLEFPPVSLEMVFVCFWTNVERLCSVLGQSYHLDRKTEQSESQPKIRYVPEENAHLA